MITEDYFNIQRFQMIEILKNYGISDSFVLKAMTKVPRHLFVPDMYQEDAYADCALPIKSNQTISQPYIVAFMTQAANLSHDIRVLEIGTGSGYQAAILGEICKEVYSVEVIQELSYNAFELLKKLGYKNVHIKVDDGNLGWLEFSPFDRILITAAANRIPQKLLDQLIVGGSIIMPLEDENGLQHLIKATKNNKSYVIDKLLNVSFVPLIISNKT